MRVLVIQTAFLGDCILSLPFLYRLAEALPDAEMDLVTSPGAGAEIFSLALRRGLAPFASRIRIHAYDKKSAHRGWRATRRFARELRGPHAPYDFAFCLQRSLRSGLLALFAGAAERVGFSTGSASFLYTKLIRREWDTGRSEVEKNLDLLRGAFHREIPAWDPITAPSLLASPARQAPTESDVALSLGSPWATKRWPHRHAVDLTRSLTREGTRVRLLGDKSAVPFGAEIRKEVPSLLVEDLTGQTSLERWVDVLATSSCVVSSDSAAVHAASDLNRPVVALFGPTVPEFGFAPWRRHASALGVELHCRPCHIHGPKICPLGHHHCLEKLPAARVEEQIRRLLAQPASPR